MKAKRIVTAENRYRKNINDRKAEKEGQSDFLKTWLATTIQSLLGLQMSHQQIQAQQQVVNKMTYIRQQFSRKLEHLEVSCKWQTSMQEMLIATNEVNQLEAKQSENGEMERIKSMVEEQNT